MKRMHDIDTRALGGAFLDLFFFLVLSGIAMLLNFPLLLGIGETRRSPRKIHMPPWPRPSIQPLRISKWTSSTLSIKTATGWVWFRMTTR